ncbi:unnamed protein product [Camellia sinensis]
MNPTPTHIQHLSHQSLSPSYGTPKERSNVSLQASPKSEDNSPPATMKKAASRNHWGLRRSKTYRENEGGGRRRVVVEEEGGGEVVVEARKSVFSIEGRKSVSHVENNVEAAAAAAAFLQVKVLVTDMPGLMQVQAFRCARRTYDRLEMFSSKHIAYNLKKGSLMRCMGRPGIALWAQVLGHSLPIPLDVSFTFQWRNFTF